LKTQLPIIFLHSVAETASIAIHFRSLFSTLKYQVLTWLHSKNAGLF